MPSSSSSRVRRMRRARVACCLASSTQQMNSLRASGVMSSQAVSAVSLPANPSPRSVGNWWTTPPGSSCAFVDPAIPARVSLPLFLIPGISA
jgi:hypothetical protein